MRPGSPASGGLPAVAGALGALGAAVAFLLAVPAPAWAGNPAPAPAAPSPPHAQCQLTDPRLPELSGLAAAADHLVAVNDGGDQVAVYVLDASCRVVDVRTAPVDPYDPEDLALGPDGTVWLADIGDNSHTRPTVALIALRPDGKASVYRLTYPDGPHDAESLLLPPNGVPYIVTKEPLGTSGVYRPVGTLADGGTVALSRVGQVSFTATGTEGGPVGPAGQLMATGGAVSGDGRLLTLRTYTDAYVWPLADSDVAGALHHAPTRIPLPASRQGEAIAFAADNRTLVVSGEGLPVDVTVVPVAAVPVAPGATPSGAAAGGSAGAHRPRSPITSAVIAAAAATALVWLGGKLRRRRQP